MLPEGIGSAGIQDGMQMRKSGIKTAEHLLRKFKNLSPSDGLERCNERTRRGELWRLKLPGYTFITHGNLWAEKQSVK